jgi:uncharacterized membrane protein
MNIKSLLTAISFNVTYIYTEVLVTDDLVSVSDPNVNTWAQTGKIS